MKSEKMPIPGSEKLTRPEELKSLSKFLGNIREVQDEHTELGQSLLDVPGKTTGYIPEIKGLGSNVENLSVPDKVELSKDVVGLDQTEKNIELESTREFLEDNTSVNLSTSVIGLDTSGKDNPGLSSDLVGLDIEGAELNLDTTRDNLSLEDHDIRLGEELQTLEDNTKIGLDTVVEKLNTPDPDLVLSGESVNIEIPEKDLTLTLGSEKLTVENESTKLESYIDSILDDSEIDLDNRVETLNTESDISLDSTKENLTIEDESITLESYTDSITDDSKINLEDTKEVLVDQREEEKLEGTRENIVLEDNTPDLSRKKELLDNTDTDISLEDSREELYTEENLNLSQEKIELGRGEEKELELSQEKKNLVIEKSNLDLSDTKIDLEEDTEDIKLSTEVKNLVGTQKSIDKVTTLGEINQDGKIVTYSADLNTNPKKQTLDDYLDSENEAGVKDFNNQIKPATDKNIDTRNTTLKDLPVLPNSLRNFNAEVLPSQARELNQNPLGEVVDKVHTLRDIDADEKLGGKIVTKSLDQNFKVGNIDELRKKLDDIPLDEQGNIVTKLDSQNPNTRFKEFLKLTNESKDLDKFKGIIRLLSDKNTTLGKTSWANKIAALVTAYLNPDSVVVDGKTTMVVKDIATYEQKLRELLAEATGVKDRKDFEEYYKLLVEAHKVENNYTEDLPENQNPKYKDVEGLSISDSRRTDFSRNISWGGASEGDYGFPEVVPEYKLPGTVTLNSHDITKYFRWCAEELIGLWKPKNAEERILRRMALDETLALIYLADQELEILTRSNRDRLPGNDYGLLSDVVSSGASGVVSGLKNSSKSALTSVFSKATGDNYNDPVNRPKVNQVTGARELVSSFEAANSRSDRSGLNYGSNGGVIAAAWEKFSSGITGQSSVTGEISFYYNYLRGKGLATTLADLCEGNKTISTVEELLQTLENAPYITTPKKFGTLRAGEYGTMTLDTNAYWEITLEPYISEKNSTCSNGGWTYLPPIESINMRNMENHGVDTKYTKWIPFIGFELQKSRVTTKSLGLYDGEIVFPISSELSNDLRVTIADDQYKSWRQYFQSCADVAIYNSMARKGEKYGNGTDTLPTIDKTSIVIANYKNITFRIKVYVMTPQFSTIRKFDLLCVMKDFMEEYSGDIDTGATDLIVNFSIVGENPGATKGSEVTTSPIGQRETEIEKNISRYNKRTTSLIKLL